MLSKWPIRNKVLTGIGLLLVIISILSLNNLSAIYSYRGLVKSLRGRATELPLAAALGQQVGDLRVTLSEIRSWRESAADDSTEVAALERPELPEHFAAQFQAFQKKLSAYCQQLEQNDQDEDTRISVAPREREKVSRIENTVGRIAELSREERWVENNAAIVQLNEQLERLQKLTVELPSALHERIHSLASSVRTQYRTLIAVTWMAGIAATCLLGLFLHLFYRWVFRPLRVLIKGSRRVAAGDFHHRIRLDTRDEMAELADALNDMTQRFQTIRDDLDRQVQLRTQQVVRSEQLASVGFLAAGVAHEINNPLASIAMCAESLEGRLQELLATDGPSDQARKGADQSSVVGNYLRMIQTEAFRCKEITEKLLDFSRLGEVRRQNVDLRELVAGVIDMIRHLGKYQNKQIVLAGGNPVIASVNSQEIKQVVLNLITNGLDSVDAGGTLTVELHTRGQEAEMLFTDNGCGMNDEVLKHLFEPFFTRKRGGQGTGLGLSIAYRIIADHEGHIEATSEGQGRGSQFRVTLPLAVQQRQREQQYQAA